MSTAGAFAVPQFRRYYLGAVAATNATWIFRVLLAWSAWDLTGSARFVGLVAAAALGAPVIAIHVLGTMLTVGRVLHGWGLSGSAGTSPGRMIGTLLTLLVYIALGAGLAVHALI